MGAERLSFPGFQPSSIAIERVLNDGMACGRVILPADDVTTWSRMTAEDAKAPNQTATGL